MTKQSRCKNASGKNQRTNTGIRNPVAQSPLIRKGGVHQRSAKAERQRAKARLRQEHDHANSYPQTVLFFTEFSDCLPGCVPHLFARRKAA